MLPGDPGYVIGRDGRGIREGLVELPGQPRQDVERARLDHHLVVVRPVALGYLAGEGQLVEVRLVEADREGPHRPGGGARHEGGDRARVHPAGEEGADGHIGDHVALHRVGEMGLQAFDPLPLADRLVGRQAEVPVA